MQLIAFLFGLLLASAAWAQGDPRLPTEAVKYLQNELTFLGARINIMAQDAEAQRKKLCDLIEEGKRPDECKR